MNCPFIDEHIIDYLEHRLSPEDEASFEAHLKVCEGCQYLVGEVKLTYALAGKLTDLKVHDAFLDQTVARLNKQEGRSVRMATRVLKPIAVAASIGFGILIGNGELEVLNESEYAEESIALSTTADYSVWQSLEESYGDED